jgi:hypothetical protein
MKEELHGGRLTMSNSKAVDAANIADAYAVKLRKHVL